MQKLYNYDTNIPKQEQVARFYGFLFQGGNKMAVLINTEEALLRLGGNEQIFKTLLNKFTNNPYYEELCAHMENNDLAEAKNNAHTIKGTAGNLGLTALFEIATALDSALKQGDDAGPLFEEFQTIYEDTMAEIKSYISG